MDRQDDFNSRVERGLEFFSTEIKGGLVGFD